VNLLAGSYLDLLVDTLYRVPLCIVTGRTYSPFTGLVNDLSVVFGCYVHPVLGRMHGGLLDFRERRILGAMGLGLGLSRRRHIVDYLEEVDVRVNVVGGVVNVGTMGRWVSVREDRLVRMTRFQVVLRQGLGAHGSWVQSLVRSEMNVVRRHRVLYRHPTNNPTVAESMAHLFLASLCGDPLSLSLCTASSQPILVPLSPPLSGPSPESSNSQRTNNLLGLVSMIPAPLPLPWDASLHH
jgi:hypothetical protein